MEKKIKVLGGLGVSPRRDRCVDRVVSGGGIIFCLPSHISVDKPMVVKRWKGNQKSS